MNNYYILAIDSLVKTFSVIDSNSEILFGLNTQNNEDVFSEINAGDKILGYVEAPIEEIKYIFSVVKIIDNEQIYLKKEIEIAQGVQIDDEILKNELINQELLKIGRDQYNFLYKDIVNRIACDSTTAKRESSLFTPEWFKEKASEYKGVDEKAEKYRKWFQENYSIDKLNEWEDIELLNNYFLLSNHDSLCYQMEYNKDSIDYFGGFGGGYAIKHLLFLSNSTKKWNTGTAPTNQRAVSEQEAISIGTTIRDCLIEGFNAIVNFGELKKPADYKGLYNKLVECTDGYFNARGFLKYYEIMIPNIFPHVNTQSAVSKIVDTLGLEDGSNIIETMGIIQEFINKCGISNVVFNCIFFDYCDDYVYEQEQTTDSLGEKMGVYGETIDPEENEIKFKEWLKSQRTSRGNIASRNMVYSNCASLHKVCELMDIAEYPDIASLFEITDIDVFYNIKSIIKGHPDYAEVNIACYNRYLNTALDWYEKYLLDLTDEEIEEDDIDSDTYSRDDFLKKAFISEDEYKELEDLLEYKKNIILQGAPGVGKTFLAKRFAYSRIGKKNNKYIEMIQFHQNYSYEDFIMGYKPSDKTFDLKPGVFYNFCKRAEKDKDHDYYFIIDEINRGNLSKIFGELLMLLEADKRGEDSEITLAYSDERFSIPENLFIIGMMNTADRSLAMMDYALRRRFGFYEIKPAFGREKFEKYLREQKLKVGIIKKIIKKLSKLNEEIADEENSGLGKGFCIGHSYFCSPPSKSKEQDSWYDRVIKHEIEPLLEEYWWDDKAKAEECIKELNKD